MGSITRQKDPVLISKVFGLSLIDSVVGQPTAAQALELCWCNTGADKLLQLFHRQVLWFEGCMFLGSQDSIVDDDADLLVVQWEHAQNVIVDTLDNTKLGNGGSR